MWCNVAVHEQFKEKAEKRTRISKVCVRKKKVCVCVSPPALLSNTWHTLFFLCHFFSPSGERRNIGYFQFAKSKATKRDFIKRALESCYLLCITSWGSLSERIRALFLKSNYMNSSWSWQWYTCKILSAALFSLLSVVSFHLYLNIWRFLSFFLSRSPTAFIINAENVLPL